LREFCERRRSGAITNTYRLLLAMMTPRERRKFWILVALTFVLSVVEAASVLSILPFLQVVANPGLIETNRVYAWLYDTFGFSSAQEFLIWTGGAVFAVTLLGLVTRIVAMWITTRFALMRSYSFSSRLMTSYLHQPYTWFLSRHTANLGSAILTEVNDVVYRSLLPAVQVIPKLFTSLLLILALCLLEPVVAIGSALVVIVFYAVVYLTIRQVLLRIGETVRDANRERYHAVQESMGGVKELKVIGLEDVYLARFRKSAYRMARVQTTGEILGRTPRFLLEGIAFGGMILLVMVLLMQRGGDLGAIVPTLAVIAAAGLRLIPALQQSYELFSTMRQGTATLVTMHRDMTGLDRGTVEAKSRSESVPVRPLTRRLELENISFSYPGTDRSALRGLNLAIEANATVGIVGGTGAGKTTLVDIMLGLLEPAEGVMRVDGEPITPVNRRAWQKTLGYVPQTIFLADGTIAENIALGQSPDRIDRAAVERAARVAALHDFIMSELPQGYDTQVGERGVRLSGGQRQRVGIARALYHDPTMLILDEATSALDNLTERSVMDAVHTMTGQKTIVMIAHRLSTVRNCDRIFLLRDGRVAASGRFEDLVTRDDEFRRMAAGA
jgi:ABC-type multidrug transport system fused ATPase/permease subunit